MTSTDNITWAGTFTPTANTEDASNTLSLATSYTDTAGNAGASATTANYAVETQAPTVSSVSTTADNQSLVSITDNITVTFSEAMESSYVTTNTSDTFCAGTIWVSSDNFSSCVKMSSSPSSSNSNRTFTLDPYDNLTSSTTYKTRVTTGVKDTAGNALSSQYETSSGFTTLSLSAPSGLTATGTAGQVSLDWSAVTSANSYTVYWDNATGISSSSTAITSVSNDNYTHSSLDNGSTYYYKVAAVDTDNTTGSLSSEVSAATPLPAPDNLSASGANNTITLTWNSVSGATSYTLYWDNVSGIDNSDTPITSITNDNYTHSSLDNGSIYYYKVAAVNSSGTGTLSSVASAILDQNIQVSKTFNGHTYALTSDLMNWDEASVNANTFGGYLTTINTKSENTFLTDEFWTSAAKPWHGADEQASEGTWLWDNGTTSGDNGLTDNLCGTKSNCLKSDATWLDGSRKWCTNNPNNSRNTNSESPAYLEYQNCGYIWNNDPNNKYGCWDDTQCSYDKKSIIEFDL